MAELIHRRNWDSKLFDTGNVDEKEHPIFGTKIQNGLHDIEPDGSFVECDTGISEVTQGVTHLKMNRGRMGELRFGDSDHPNNFLVKIKNKAMKGISFKYTGATGSAMTANNGKPLCNFDNGISIESIPYYKGVKMDIIIQDPLTAPLEYPFSIKTYGQNYNFIEENGGATLRGEDQGAIFIKPPYAVDANGDIGPVTIHYTGMDGNLITFKKIVDETWFRQAAAPVIIDPNVTIDDDSGTFIDTFLSQSAANRDKNYGVSTQFYSHRFTPGSNEVDGINWVDLTSFSGVTVTAAHFGATIQIRQGNGYNYKIHRILAGDWVEGTKDDATAGIDEPCFNWRKFNTVPWNVAGCRGAGTDYQTIPESTTFVGSIGLHTFTVIAATLQDMIENPSANYGFIWRTDDAAENEFEIFHSSEGTGDKPFLYFEFTGTEVVFPSIPVPMPLLTPAPKPPTIPGGGSDNTWITN